MRLQAAAEVTESGPGLCNLTEALETGPSKSMKTPISSSPRLEAESCCRPRDSGHNADEGGLSSSLLLCLLPPFVTAADFGDGAPSSMLLLGLKGSKDIWLCLPLLVRLLPVLHALLGLGVGQAASSSPSLLQLLPGPKICLWVWLSTLGLLAQML